MPQYQLLLEDRIAAFNRGELALLGDLVAPSFSGQHPLTRRPLVGPEGLIELFGDLRRGFPDAIHPSWMILSDGDLLAVHTSLEGTFNEPYLGIPATGRKIAFWIVELWRVNGGKLAEAWMVWDSLRLMSQLEAIRPPPLGSDLPGQ